MRIDAYYIITVKPDFLAHWPFDPDLAALLRGPMLYKHGEGGRSAFFEEDHAALVKLLFLASIKANYPPELDSLPVTLGQFDLLWVMERIKALDGDLARNSM